MNAKTIAMTDAEKLTAIQSKISATRCDASENATAGLFVHDGGVLNVTDCLVSGNTNAGGNASGLLAQTRRYGPRRARKEEITTR